LEEFRVAMDHDGSDPHQSRGENSGNRGFMNGVSSRSRSNSPTKWNAAALGHVEDKGSFLENDHSPFALGDEEFED
jgi:hypothetical protein